MEQLINRIRVMLNYADVPEIRARLISDYTDIEIFFAYKAAKILTKEI